jgi:putative oxygen-independent coproporphyrinogen III oxidase
MACHDPPPPPPGDGLALYVHWPFCRAKCPYCDFNSHVRHGVDAPRWQRALLTELERMAAETPGRALTSIFFGGGTPSLMPPGTVAAVIAAACRHWPSARPIEITLEANPTSVEAGRLQGFREAGVNRVSLGIQALDDAALAFLGREHGVGEALAALELAQRTFPRVSFDLIYARPGQSAAAWRAELGRALAQGTGHLSLYQLTIEPGTRFHTLHSQGRLTMPDDEAQALLFELTQDMLGEAGFRAYEVSNHARPGETCRHNLVYWRSGDWHGLGPGAHGRLSLAGKRVATQAVRLPETWLRAVETMGSGELSRVGLTAEDRLEELLLMGLRLEEGVPLERLMGLRRACPPAAFDERALERMVAADLLRMAGGRVAATPAGRRLLSSVLATLLG